jgi:hypothetical protein
MNKIKDLPLPLPWERLPLGADDVNREPLLCRYCNASDIYAANLRPDDEQRRVLAHQTRCISRPGDEPVTDEERQAYCGFHSIRLLRAIRIRESCLNATIQKARRTRAWSFLRRRDLRNQIATIRWEISQVHDEAERLGLPDDWEGQAMIRSVGLDPEIFHVAAMHRR